MNTTATIEKLYDLRLGVMAEAFSAELTRSGEVSLSFAERVGLLVDRQWAAREEARLSRRLKKANLKTPSACVEEIDFRTPRGLNREVVLDLAGLGFLGAAGNVILTGPTGLGKTYLACALADRACRRGFAAAYCRLPRLVFELALARADGTYLKALAALAKVELLILDDWGLVSLDVQASADVMDVIDDRAGVRSTIVTSQLPVSEWHSLIADQSIADALLDRLVHRAVRIELKGESMRKQGPQGGPQLT
ncbi:MAG: IS21-like element helper ATPase IstB [Actinobacteria bacterium]|nr:IS21-like element helper ATPase IstB [Actinomycetota bacterium]